MKETRQELIKKHFRLPGVNEKRKKRKEIPEKIEWRKCDR